MQLEDDKNVIAKLSQSQFYKQLLVRKHKLVNNCLKCGRIVCEQEGCGPCLYCGNPVFSTQEDKNIDNNNKQIAFLSQIYFSSLQIVSNPDDLIDSALAEEFPEISGINNKKQKQKKEGKKVENFQNVQKEQEKEAKRLEFERNVAVGHRDKLIEQDNEQNLQKNIYDSQMDWYEISHDVWQSKETRDQAVRNMIAEQIDYNDDKKKIQIEFDGWGAGFKEIKPHKNEDKSKENAHSFIAEVEKLRRNQEQQQVATIETTGQIANFKEAFGSDAKNEKLSKEALQNAKMSLLNSCPTAQQQQQDQKPKQQQQPPTHFPGAKRVLTEIYEYDQENYE